MTNVVSEINERKARENNMIIYGAEESKSQLKTEKLKKDTATLNKIAEICDVDVEGEDVQKIIRLGPKKENAVRPILVSFSSSETKKSLLRNAYKLKQQEDEYKDISLSHDMTKAERMEVKKLLAEAKD